MVILVGLRYNLDRSSLIDRKGDDMGGINTGRWLVGGLVAGIVIWICEGVASIIGAWVYREN